jgi:hypothetical protein
MGGTCIIIGAKTPRPQNDNRGRRDYDPNRGQSQVVSCFYCLRAHEFRCRFSKSMLAYVVYSDFGVIAVSMADYRAIIGVVGSCPRFFNLWKEPSLIWI